MKMVLRFFKRFDLDFFFVIKWILTKKKGIVKLHLKRSTSLTGYATFFL
jgi:hypothetical protein